MSRFQARSDDPSSAMLKEDLCTRHTILPGENIIFYHNFPVGDKQIGHMFITNWAVRVVYDIWDENHHDFTLPLHCVFEINKLGGKKRPGFYGLEIVTSSLVEVVFEMNPSEKETRNQIIHTIKQQQRFPLCLPIVEWSSERPWMQQMQEKTGWSLHENTSSPTYPDQILIPPDVDESTLKGCLKYRSKQRIPLVSFITEDGIVLLRSSQPLTGLTKKQSEADKKYIQSAIHGHPLKIMDCRPKVNASANKIKGGGYEDTSYGEYIFLGIPNIHKVRKFYQEYHSSPRNPNSQWGVQILRILESARMVADSLRHGCACLVHCTDGWDRTSQVTALAQIYANPAARTFNGFKELLERDWLDAGHMFGLRCGHYPLTKNDECSPIFLQFIDCIIQLIRRCPNEFEFNDNFLVFIAFHAYAQLFGDFWGNKRSDREGSERPVSLWLLADQFANPDFHPGDLNVQVTKYLNIPELTSAPIPGAWNNFDYSALATL